jgi:hypothetical protein
MALFGKGVVWKINQQLYLFRKWRKKNWQWAITTVIAIVGIIVVYMARRA